MRKIKFLILSLFFILISFSSNSLALYYDFTSNHITIENDEILTNESGYPVLKITNNTNKDLDITYSFYINETDSSHYYNNFIIKSNDEIILEIPELSNLGLTNETRTIWFSWNEEGNIKPLQNEIKTVPFKSIETPNSPESQLGLN